MKFFIFFLFIGTIALQCAANKKNEVDVLLNKFLDGLDVDYKETEGDKTEHIIHLTKAEISVLFSKNDKIKVTPINDLAKQNISDYNFFLKVYKKLPQKLKKFNILEDESYLILSYEPKSNLLVNSLFKGEVCELTLNNNKVKVSYPFGYIKNINTIMSETKRGVFLFIIKNVHIKESTEITNCKIKISMIK